MVVTGHGEVTQRTAALLLLLLRAKHKAGRPRKHEGLRLSSLR